MSVSPIIGTGYLFEEVQPEPVRGHGKIQIGTSGYSFDDWRGSFYPEKLSRSKWLDYYAKTFSCVEINATYYYTPPAATFKSMAERTPPEFEFWVKVPGLATHSDDDLKSSIAVLNEAVKPLKESGKLSGLLAQFPQSFRKSDKNYRRIAEIHDLIENEPLAVEFRRTEWIDHETSDFLKNHNIIFVSVDLPTLPDLPGREVLLTADAAYVRLHGRNNRAWHNPEFGDRYDYDYSSAELKEWLPRISYMDERCATTYLFFNNCHAGQAVKNARMLRELLKLDFNCEH